MTVFRNLIVQQNNINSYNIDPFQYSNGLFLNFDGKCMFYEDSGTGSNLSNLASCDIYFQSQASIRDDIKDNHIVFRGSNGWYTKEFYSSSSTRTKLFYPYTNDQLSLECLVKVSNEYTEGDGEYFISNIQYGGFGLYRTIKNIPRVSININDTYNYLSSSKSIELEQINYIAVTYNNEKISIYVNPINIDDVDILPASGNIKHSGAPIALGYDPSTNGAFGGYALVGEIYSAKVWNRALSPEEVIAHYNYDKQRFNF